MSTNCEPVDKQQIKAKMEFKEPPMYKVLILNDNQTPMPFVVKVLMSVFHMNAATAKQRMTTAHQTGQSLCGIYTMEVAETKLEAVRSLAKKCKYPLSCCMEAN